MRELQTDNCARCNIDKVICCKVWLTSGGVEEEEEGQSSSLDGVNKDNLISPEGRRH